MIDFGYASPVNRLLLLGESVAFQTEWTDYRLFGIDSQDAAELVRMATDLQLHNLPGDELAVWAPIHALRALGQLRIEAAVDPLLEYLASQPWNEIDDWTYEETPETIGMIGASALPSLVQFLGRVQLDVSVRDVATRALVKLAQRDMESRPLCVAALADQLEMFAEQPAAFNAILIGALIDLKAAETLPLIERAHAAGVVDESINGDLEDVQVYLGVKPQREHPRQPLHRDFWRLSQEPSISAGSLTLGMTADERRQLAKQRKQQRKVEERARQQQAKQRRQGHKRH
jgi:hypothetical protein